MYKLENINIFLDCIPRKDPEEGQLPDGRKYHASKIFRDALANLRKLPTNDLIDIIGVRSFELEMAYYQRIIQQCERLHELLLQNRVWREDGEVAKFDDYMIKEWLDFDVTRKTLLRQCREKRVDIVKAEQAIELIEDQTREGIV